MNKVFSKHLFFKLGLLISTYALSQTSMKVYSSDNNISEQARARSSALWSIDDKAQLQKMIDQANSNLIEESDSYFDLTPVVPDAKQLNAMWDQDTGNTVQKKPLPANANVFFSVDYQPQNYAEVNNAPEAPLAEKNVQTKQEFSPTFFSFDAAPVDHTQGVKYPQFLTETEEPKAPEKVETQRIWRTTQDTIAVDEYPFQRPIQDKSLPTKIDLEINPFSQDQDDNKYGSYITPHAVSYETGEPEQPEKNRFNTPYDVTVTSSPLPHPQIPAPEEGLSTYSDPEQHPELFSSSLSPQPIQQPIQREKVEPRRVFTTAEMSDENWGIQQPIQKENVEPRKVFTTADMSDERWGIQAPSNNPAAPHQMTMTPPKQQISYQSAPSHIPLNPFLAQAAPPPAQAPAAAPTQASTPPLEGMNRTIRINFNNVNIIEFIRFISRISNKNFVFDEADLQFNVTIVSEEPTTIENIMTALLQELRIHDLTLIEQGNNLIIHKNPRVNSISKVVSDDLPLSNMGNSELITQVFRLNTLDPDRAAAIIRPLMSDRALVEFIRETNHLIVTDLSSNIVEIGKLLKSIDAPNSGLVIGQYVARTTDIGQLVPMVQQIMAPISKDHPLVFVPYENSNSIFIVSSPFLVERSISILQHLDQDKGRTRIINLQELQFEGKGQKQPTKPITHPSVNPSETERGRESGWEFGPGGGAFVRPETYPGGRGPGGAGAGAGAGGGNENLGVLPLFIPVEIPVSSPSQDQELRETRAALDALQALKNQKPIECPPQQPAPWRVGITEFPQEEIIPTERLLRRVHTNPDFVPVPVNRSKFYIHKLQYRFGDSVQAQLQQIASSMSNCKGNDDLIAAINSVQWLVDSKSLVFCGTPENLDKVRELVEQVDLPLRQVFIEMLLLNTTVDDSLNFAVNYATRFGGGNQAGSQGFLSGASPLQGVMDSTGVNDLGGTVPNFFPTSNSTNTLPYNNVLVPDPTTLAKQTGFSLGVIGQKIIHKGLGIEFNSIGALVTALHDRTVSTIVMSPKIITEDGVPAQIFVGITTPFKTQSVANDLGSILTNNFQYQDVGSSLMVTPHLHNSDLVTLQINQELSSIATITTASQNINNTGGPTVNKNSTQTTVNVPNGYFVIISGMMEDDSTRERINVPCIGTIPLLGGAFSDKRLTEAKRNLMIFIRPVIVDTDEEIQNITRHEQDVWKFKNIVRKTWVQETEEALDFFNVRRTMNTDDQDDPEIHQFAH